MFLSRPMRIIAAIAIPGLSAGLTFGFAPTASRSQEAKSALREGEPAPPAPLTTPITVRGRATDSEGKPVAGATIYLVSTNGKDALLGTTTTDRDGAYTFRNARLPVSRWRDDTPLAGTFQVYGIAPGLGFAWHGMRFYQPRRRPADWKVAGEDYTLFGDDPKIMDLRLPPAATLSGRVLDETGRPVADARIRIGSCDYLDTEGKESHVNFREFWAIHALSGSLTTTKSGPDGSFRLDGLPREAGFRIFVEHPDYAWMNLYAATTNRPVSAFEFPRQMIAGHEPPPVEMDPLKITLHSTRRIAVRTIFADSGRPAPRVRVSVGRRPAGTSANGISDADGRILLRLPPGDYEGVADPTEGGAAMIRTRISLQVKDRPAEQPLEVRVKPGCVLVLEVVDARTGKGVLGVDFLCEPDGQPGSRVMVQSRTGYIDNPRSDADGRLRAVVEPGERSYMVGHIPEFTGYRQQSSQRRVALPGGGTVTVRFELQQ